MIPKIIHYIWLGRNKLPLKMQECVDSWKQWMPNYQVIVWDDERIKEIDNVFMLEAIEEKKWAFVSDVVRLYAVAKYGGIYFDTDVFVYKSFDPLLKYRAFIGRENSMHIIGRKTVNYLTTCCFGAEKGNEFIMRCLGYYNKRHFITSRDNSLPMELRLDVKLNSQIFALLASQIGYDASVLKNEEQHCGNSLVVFPSYYFDAVGVHPDAFSVHLALGTWRENVRNDWNYTWKYKISWRIWSLFEQFVRMFNRTIIKLN